MQMITAESIKADLLTLNACEGLDEWINSNVKPKFIQNAGGRPVHIDQSIVTRIWNGHAFENAMIKRGFRVELICEDRPCAIPYFKIEL